MEGLPAVNRSDRSLEWEKLFLWGHEATKRAELDITSSTLVEAESNADICRFRESVRKRDKVHIMGEEGEIRYCESQRKAGVFSGVVTGRYLAEKFVGAGWIAPAILATARAGLNANAHGIKDAGVCRGWD